MEEHRETLEECRRLARELRREMAGARRDIDSLARMLVMGFEDAATKDDIATLSVEIEERMARPGSPGVTPAMDDVSQPL